MVLAVLILVAEKIPVEEPESEVVKAAKAAKTRQSRPVSQKPATKRQTKSKKQVRGIH